VFPQPFLLIFHSIEIFAEDSYTVLIVIELCIKKLRNDMGFAKLSLFATQGAYLLGHVDFIYPVLAGFVYLALPVFHLLPPTLDTLQQNTGRLIVSILWYEFAAEGQGQILFTRICKIQRVLAS
jgi:hypothetical protein